MYESQSTNIVTLYLTNIIIFYYNLYTVTTNDERGREQNTRLNTRVRNSIFSAFFLTCPTIILRRSFYFMSLPVSQRRAQHAS